MGKRIKILYVEDEELIRENTKRPLQYLCDELIVAPNGAQGLELYKHNTDIDIVVSDIKMPKMNGIEMCKAIKEINENQHIIFTTAHSENRYFMEAIEMQVDGYILKPIDYNLLENKIKSIIKHINLKIDNEIQQEKIHQQELQILEQAKNAQMGEILGNIAHQWRQPLSVISTAATGMLLQKDYGLLDDEKFVQSCNSIDETAQFLSETINIFNNYIQEKKELKKVILQDRIRTAINVTKHTLEMYDIDIVTNIDEVEPIEVELVIGDLTQVLINIINNAKDVLIQREIENKIISIDLQRKDNKIYILIEDNAGGISDDIIDKVFDPYFTTKHQSQGTGLGLYMSKKITEESLKGELSVKNSEKGAIFTLSMPIESN